MSRRTQHSVLKIYLVGQSESSAALTQMDGPVNAERFRRYQTNLVTASRQPQSLEVRLLDAGTEQPSMAGIITVCVGSLQGLVTSQGYPARCY